MSLMMFGDWKPLPLAKVPQRIHEYYVPDAWVETIRKHDEREEILIEFDPETAERLGAKIHLWRWHSAQGVWQIDKTI